MKPIILEKELVEESYNRLKNRKAVASELGYSLKVINKMCKLYGLESYNNLPRVQVDKKAFTELYDTHNQAEMAIELGISIASVKRLFKEYGLVVSKSSGKGKTLSDIESQVILGSLLGDGHISNYGYMEITHCLKQYDYMIYKKDLLSRIIKPSVYTRKNTDGSNHSYRIRTETMQDLKDLRELWYPDGSIQLPNNWKEHLTPLSLAIWFLDDGTRKGVSYGNIATCSFTEEEVTTLSDGINDVFNLRTYPRRDTKYFIIYIPSNSFSALSEIIEPYTAECMRYKLSQGVTTK